MWHLCFLALFHGDKATECSHSACHHEKQSAAKEKGQIHTNYCILNTRVYAHIFLLCLNVDSCQIEAVIDSCNYEKIGKQDYWFMPHIAGEPSFPGKGNVFPCSRAKKPKQGCGATSLFGSAIIGMPWENVLVVNISRHRDLQVNEILSQGQNMAETWFLSPSGHDVPCG